MMSRLPMYDVEEEASTIQSIDVIDFSPINLDEICEAQREDKLLQKVLHKLETSNSDTLSSRASWPFIDKLNELFIDDQILFRCVYKGHIQIVLPPVLHDKVLRLLHYEPTGDI